MSAERIAASEMLHRKYDSLGRTNDKEYGV